MAKFIDEVSIRVKAGDGGRGCVSFRREKYVPKGGPDGGDGGKGGDIVLIADPQKNTLLDLHLQKFYKAKNGGHGRGKNQHGRDADDVEIRVPLGTVVRDAETGKIIKDMVVPGERFIVAKGGRGGRGNTHFVSPTRQAPRFAEEGKKGEEKTLILELKLLADCGIVGVPNAGKSTLLSRISAAKPRIAPFPFTTLTPNLGMIRHKDTDFVMADIPGIIEGAHKGAGLGIKFLRHIERTSVILFLLDISQDPYEDAGKTYEMLLNELSNHSNELSLKPRVVALNKIDLPHVRNKILHWSRFFEKLHIKLFPISAITGEGLESLLDEIVYLIRNVKKE